MSRTPVAPFLINKHQEGHFRITVRTLGRLPEAETGGQNALLLARAVCPAARQRGGGSVVAREEDEGGPRVIDPAPPIDPPAA